MRFFKLGALLISAAIAAACCAAFNTSLCFDEGESYTFYCGNTSANCTVVTVNGNAALKKLTLKEVCGEGTTYTDLDIAAFLESVNGEVLFEERLSDSVNYYCSADLPYSVQLYGQEVNLHICVKESGVMVASPIIFGGY